jgi:hypothetical protein
VEGTFVGVSLTGKCSHAQVLLLVAMACHLMLLLLQYGFMPLVAFLLSIALGVSDVVVSETSFACQSMEQQQSPKPAG